MQKIDYKFNEDVVLEYLKHYIDKTYEAHYAQGKIQATEFIFDSEHGKGFLPWEHYEIRPKIRQESWRQPSRFTKDYSLRHNAIRKTAHYSIRRRRLWQVRGVKAKSHEN